MAGGEDLLHVRLLGEHLSRNRELKSQHLREFRSNELPRVEGRAITYSRLKWKMRCETDPVLQDLMATTNVRELVASRYSCSDDSHSEHGLQQATWLWRRA